MIDVFKDPSYFVSPVKTEPEATVWLSGEARGNQVLSEFDFKFHGESLSFSMANCC